MNKMAQVMVLVMAAIFIAGCGNMAASPTATSSNSRLPKSAEDVAAMVGMHMCSSLLTDGDSSSLVSFQESADKKSVTVYYGGVELCQASGAYGLDYWARHFSNSSCDFSLTRVNAYNGTVYGAADPWTGAESKIYFKNKLILQTKDYSICDVLISAEKNILILSDYGSFPRAADQAIRYFVFDLSAEKLYDYGSYSVPKN